MKILKQVWSIVSIICALFCLVIIASVVITPLGKIAGKLSIVKKMTDVPEPEKIVRYSYQTPEYASYKKALDAIEKREQDVEKTEKQQSEKESQLKMFEGELASQRNELEKIQNAIKSILVELQLSEKKNIKRLANVYSLMAPEDAVPIIEELDDETIVQILSLMKERQAARLMGAFAQANENNAVRAAKISKMMQRLVAVEKNVQTVTP